MPDRTVQNSDFSFTVPDDWIDRTIIAWSAPLTRSPIPPNFMIAYDKLRAAEELGTYVNRQLADLSKSAQNFQLELRRDVQFQGRPAVELIFRWAAPAGAMKQRQLYAQMTDGRVINLTSTARESEFQAADQIFLETLGSFRWMN
jgi:hypothetical protein